MPTLPPEFSILADGSLMVPVRGTPPPAPEGYEQSAGDPYVYVPVLVDCTYREAKVKDKSTCCAGTHYLYCNYKKITVSRGDCKSCGANPEAYFHV